MGILWGGAPTFNKENGFTSQRKDLTPSTQVDIINSSNQKIAACPERDAMEPLLRPFEIASILGVHVRTVYRMCRSGLLPSLTLPGDHVRVPTEALAAFIEEKLAEAKKARQRGKNPLFSKSNPIQPPVKPVNLKSQGTERWHSEQSSPKRLRSIRQDLFGPNESPRPDAPAEDNGR